MTNRNNPFEMLERTFERMSQQFDDAARAWESGDPFEMSALTGESVAMDLIEREEEYVVTVDLPGFDRDDIEVKMVEDRLMVAAEREEAEEDEAENYLRRERRHRSVSRSIRLPEDVDPENVTAKSKRGVLTVTIPRVHTESESRTIEIESE